MGDRPPQHGLRFVAGLAARGDAFVNQSLPLELRERGFYLDAVGMNVSVFDDCPDRLVVVRQRPQERAFKLGESRSFGGTPVDLMPGSIKRSSPDLAS